MSTDAWSAAWQVVKTFAGIILFAAILYLVTWILFAVAPSQAR